MGVGLIEVDIMNVSTISQRLRVKMPWGDRRARRRARQGFHVARRCGGGMHVVGDYVLAESVTVCTACIGTTYIVRAE